MLSNKDILNQCLHIKQCTMAIGANAYFVVRVVAGAGLTIRRRIGRIAAPVSFPEADAARGAAVAPV